MAMEKEMKLQLKRFGWFRWVTGLGGALIAPLAWLWLSSSAGGVQAAPSKKVLKEVLTLRGRSGSISTLVLSRDGKRLFSADLDRSIQSWNVETGSPNGRFEGHTARVTSLALSKDGKR